MYSDLVKRDRFLKTYSDSVKRDRFPKTYSDPVKRDRIQKMYSDLVQRDRFPRRSVNATTQIEAQQATAWVSPTLFILSEGVPIASFEAHPEAPEDVPLLKKEVPSLVAEEVILPSSTNTKAATFHPVTKVPSSSAKEHCLTLQSKDTPIPPLIKIELGVEDYVLSNEGDV
ncbi:hypothetical protein NE237_002645 [Protea cynaroides]|uniref:Uncharacterized protein n=1 Tax=Protea cynaroides TaxID=273540 RepID=A0A9Q0GKZ5_9MAGN|nr:hypothetical protein NE237_002645 [Protea cynaroides]